MGHRKTTTKRGMMAMTTSGGTKPVVKHKRRYCKVQGCTKIVKSQGLCQSHGAKPRTCKVDGCAKQAQGNFDGMCKSHFKSYRKCTTGALAPQVENLVEPPPPEGASAYDTVLPASIGWTATSGAADGALMPLIQHLKDGFDQDKPSGWHRNEERRARGLFPVSNTATQLEGWERELVWMEILILTGVPGASFRHLARAWGRDKGFHMVLAQFICERRGNVERKKRGKVPGGGTGSSSAADRKAKKQQGQLCGADAWDDACYGTASYNEALALDLFETFHNNDDDDEGANDTATSADDDDDDDGDRKQSTADFQQHQHHQHHPHQQQQAAAVAEDHSDDSRVVSSSEDDHDGGGVDMAEV